MTKKKTPQPEPPDPIAGLTPDQLQLLDSAITIVKQRLFEDTKNSLIRWIRIWFAGFGLVTVVSLTSFVSGVRELAASKLAQNTELRAAIREDVSKKADAQLAEAIATNDEQSEILRFSAQQLSELIAEVRKMKSQPIGSAP